jgi:hypothetical protein
VIPGSVRWSQAQPGWVAASVPYESALERLFREAEQEIVLTACTISSGAGLLLEWLEAADQRHTGQVDHQSSEQPATNGVY